MTTTNNTQNIEVVDIDASGVVTLSGTTTLSGNTTTNNTQNIEVVDIDASGVVTLSGTTTLSGNTTINSAATTNMSNLSLHKKINTKHDLIDNTTDLVSKSLKTTGDITSSNGTIMSKDIYVSDTIGGPNMSCTDIVALDINTRNIEVIRRVDIQSDPENPQIVGGTVTLYDVILQDMDTPIINIPYESMARILDIPKQRILICGEASGELTGYGTTIGSGPSSFSFGNSSKSNKVGYGLPIPFNFDLVSAILIVDTDAISKFEASFNIVRYALDNTTSEQLGSITITAPGVAESQQKFADIDNGVVINSGTNISRGSICIECVSYTPGVDNADVQVAPPEWRLSMALRCNDLN